MAELLLRPVGAQNQVPAEQVGLKRLALEPVAVPGEPHPDLLARRVARLPDARRRLHILPRPRQVGKDVLETRIVTTPRGASRTFLPDSGGFPSVQTIASRESLVSGCHRPLDRQRSRYTLPGYPGRGSVLACPAGEASTEFTRFEFDHFVNRMCVRLPPAPGNFPWTHGRPTYPSDAGSE